MRILRGCAIAAALPVLILVVLFALEAGENDEKALSSAQVVGVWKGSGAGRIEFLQGGRFEMTGIPRSAVVFSFTDPPPGNGGLSGSGEWNLKGDTGKSGTVELRFDATDSFSDGSASALLQVQRTGDQPELYFDTNVDKRYGYEMRRITAKSHE
ncbi:hypothetical protein [Streptomyces sp. NPDC012510]|uniref:hypothetical protein n=1 Tax=Streptomyces sp. NPDC012510 TaxID=3364838 RepID=UPI0036E5DC28